MQTQQLNPNLTREKRVRLAILADLLLIAFLLACGLHARWSAHDWQTPVQYGAPGGSFNALLAGAKTVSQGHYIPFFSHRNSEFGAPLGADWGNNPGAEQTQILVAAILGKVVGVFTAVNLMVVLAHVLAVLGFYVACRALDYAWEWSAAGALLFGFASYLCAWSEHRLAVACVAHIPLLILVFRWAIDSRSTAVVPEPEPASQRAKKKPGRRGSEPPETAITPASPVGRGLLDNTRFYWALGIAVFTGFNYDGYTILLMQFMGLAALYHALQKRWVCAGRSAAVALAGLLTGFFLDSLSGGHRQGADAVSASHAFRALEASGFKIADLFVAPPTHWFPPLARWGERYYAEVVLKADLPAASYLGIAGVAALLWLAAVSIWNLDRRPANRPPAEAFLAGSVILFAMVGGAGAWLSSLGFALSPASNRIVICLLALVLMFAVRRLSLLTAGWKSQSRLILASVIALAGVWDQVPRGLSAHREGIAKAVASDRAFTRQMEARLKPDAMVFQLPVMPLVENSVLGEPLNTPVVAPAIDPENPAVTPYDQFRPSLHSNALRFSAGDLKGAQNAWQGEASQLEPAAFIDRLEKYGFGAICLNLPGCSAHGEAYLKAAEIRGAPVIHSPAGDLACILLKPAASPTVPSAPPYFGRGWYEQDTDRSGRLQRCCTDSGDLVLTNPQSEPTECTIKGLLVGFDYRTLQISTGNTVFQQMQLKPGHGLRIDKKVTLRPGENVFTFSTDQPGIPTARGPVGFVLTEFQITDGKSQ